MDAHETKILSGLSHHQMSESFAAAAAHNKAQTDSTHRFAIWMTEHPTATAGEIRDRFRVFMSEQNGLMAKLAANINQAILQTPPSPTGAPAND